MSTAAIFASPGTSLVGQQRCRSRTVAGGRSAALTVVEYGAIVASMYERRDDAGLLRHPTLVVYTRRRRGPSRGDLIAVHPLTDDECVAWWEAGDTGAGAIACAAATRCGYRSGQVCAEIDATGAVTGPWIAQARRRA